MKKVAEAKQGWHGLRTLTVGELIAALEDEDPEMPVVFACDYGDYHHTQQVLGIKGEMEEEPVHESAYSQSGWAIPSHDEERYDEDDDEDEEKDEPKVLVLR